MKRKQEISSHWFVKGIALIIICFALWFLFLPIKAEHACTGTSFQRVLLQQRQHKKLRASEQEKLEIYEQKYNDHLFQQQQKNQPTAVPTSNHYKKRGGYLGSLTIPSVGLHHTLIGMPKETADQSKIHLTVPSSFPSVEGSNRVILEIEKGWSSQSLLQKIWYLKTGDLFYVETHESIFYYKLQKVQPLSKVKQTKEGVFPIQKDQRDCLIVYHPPLAQPMVLTAVQVSEPATERLIVRRTFLTYGQTVGLFLFVNGAIFLLLIWQYHRMIPKFFTKSTRVKKTSTRSLYTLLQVTRGYYLVFGLIIALFFFFLGYIYFLF